MQTAAHAALEQLAGIAWQDVRTTLLHDLKSMPVTLADVEQDAQPALHQAIHSHIGTLLDARRTDVVARVVAQCHATMLQLPTARPKATAPSGGIGLRFTHPCMGIACSDADCGLCKHNPAKRCRPNEYLSDKYLEQDQLTARCGAELVLQPYSLDTGETVAVPDALIGASIEIVVINGTVAPDGRLPPTFDFDNPEQVFVSHSDNQPLLVPGVGARQNERLAVVTDLQEGDGQTLPRIAITKSSESLLSGRKATFRLVARVMGHDNVVATRRVKGNLKNDIPFVDEPLVKLDGVGRQTAEKLADLSVASRKAAVRIELPPILTEYGRKGVLTVGELRELMQEAEKPNFTELKSSLMSILKLNTEQWQRTLKRVTGAIERDNRLRVWTPSARTGSSDADSSLRGVLFDCKQGKMVLDRPIGLVLFDDGPDAPAPVVRWDELNSEQRETMESLKERALEAWHQPRHPGWDACAVDLDQLEQLHYCLPPREAQASTFGTPKLGLPMGGQSGVLQMAGPSGAIPLAGTLPMHSGPSGTIAMAAPSGQLPTMLPPHSGAQQAVGNMFAGGLAHLAAQLPLQPLPDLDLPSFPSNPLLNSTGLQALLGSLGGAANTKQGAAAATDALSAALQLDSIPLVTLPGGGIASGISLGAFLGNLSDLGGAVLSDLGPSSLVGGAQDSLPPSALAVPGTPRDGATPPPAVKFGTDGSMMADLLKARGGGGEKREREEDESGQAKKLKHDE